MHTEMSDSELAAAIAEQDSKTQALREKQAILKQQATILEIAKLQRQAKVHDEEAAAEAAVLEQIARNQLQRKQKEEAQAKIDEAVRHAEAIERQKLEAKEVAERKLRSDKETALRIATERRFAEEQETKRLQYILEHPPEPKVEPKPPTLADAGHPLSFIFGAKAPAVVEVIPEISLRENLALAAQEPLPYAQPRAKRAVDGNFASALQQLFRREMNGEYPSSAACITLLEKVSLEDITKAFPLMKQAHAKRPMSVEGMLNYLIVLIDPTAALGTEADRPVDRMQIKSVAKPVEQARESYADYLHRVTGLPDFTILSKAEWERQTA